VRDVRRLHLHGHGVPDPLGERERRGQVLRYPLLRRRDAVGPQDALALALAQLQTPFGADLGNDLAHRLVVRLHGRDGLVLLPFKVAPVLHHGRQCPDPPLRGGIVGDPRGLEHLDRGQHFLPPDEGGDDRLRRGAGERRERPGHGGYVHEVRGREEGDDAGHVGVGHHRADGVVVAGGVGVAHNVDGVVEAGGRWKPLPEPFDGRRFERCQGEAVVRAGIRGHDPQAAGVGDNSHALPLGQGHGREGL